MTITSHAAGPMQQVYLRWYLLETRLYTELRCNTDPTMSLLASFVLEILFCAGVDGGLDDLEFNEQAMVLFAAICDCLLPVDSSSSS